MPSARLAMCLLSCLCAEAVLSQPVSIPKIFTPVNIDGTVAPGEWDNINPLPLVSHWPAYADQPNTRTKLRVAYDENYFYIAASCYDDPSLIQAPYFDRDNWGMEMDQICFLLDTYNDNENAVVFAVTATGSRIDCTLRNDAQGDEPIDLSWNSYWDAQVSQDSAGWYVEARVPFSSLRFQPVDGIVTMGLIAYRYVARERQMDIYPAIKPDWGFWSFLKPSQAQDVTFSNLNNTRPWFITPYALAGIGHHHVTPDNDPAPKKVNDDKITAGLDIQHAITDNLNLDLTLNTDFAQVEADDQVVNLSRFSLFFPEKRRFFLERSSIMDFGFELNNRLFYSRRIGLHEGQLVPLWGGARVVGRIKDYDVGILNMQSRDQDGLPSENFGVFRLRRKISQGNSFAGAILTTRTDFKGNTNLAYGIDGIINVFKNDYIKVNLAGSSAADSIENTTLLEDRKRIYLLWENRALVGFNYAFSYSRADKYYDPGLGFEQRKNFQSFGDRVSYAWFTKNAESLRYVRFDIYGSAFLSNTTQRIETWVASPTMTLEWKKNNSLKISVSRLYDDVPEAFNLSDEVSIAPGKYINKDIGASYETPPVNFLKAIFQAKAGTLYGGDLRSASLEPLWVLSKYLTLSGYYQFNSVSFSDLPDYQSHIGRVKILASLNVKWNFQAFVQYNSLSEISIVNFRLRYNPRDGNDLYLVYNEILNTEGKTDPLLPTSESRAVILKYAYTFIQ